MANHSASASNQAAHSSSQAFNVMSHSALNSLANMGHGVSNSYSHMLNTSNVTYNGMSNHAHSSFNQQQNAAHALANAANQQYNNMAHSAQQSYQQQAAASQQAYHATNGYAQSAYHQQQEAAHLAWNSMSAESRAMHNEMRQAWRSQQMAMGPMRDQMMKTQYDYFKLTQASRTYRGTTEEFMGTVRQLGAEQKRAADQALAANELAKMSMIQTAGTMMNMSTQAEKITGNYQRMRNPLYQVNAGGLAIANSFNKLALAGDASVLALKMLGPTANMKQLTDMQNMITQGQMRIGMVAMATAVTAGIAYKSLWEAAKGPDPSKIYAEQEAALQKYKDAVVARTTEIVNTWNIFEKAQTNATKPQTLMTNLQGQVNVMKNWNANLNSIAQKAPKEFADYLSQLGPKAAGEVAAINSMSQPELDKYVALWQEKTALAKERATTELEGLKAETQAKIKELGDSLTPLGIAFEKFKSVWTDALKPMVEAFQAVLVPVLEFATEIGKLVIKFNEANPTLALFVQGAMMLVPALMLLLSPLAAGVGLFNGIKVAMNAAWMIIGPLVTGLAAMSATVWIVAAAIAALVVGFTYLWNTNEGFRNAVISAWEAIKSAAIAVWNFILNNAIRPAMAAIGAFVGDKLREIQAFWDENGAQIMQAATNAWNGIVSACQAAMAFLQPIFEIAWMVIKEIVIGTWEAIKNVINGALNVIMGIVKVFSGLFTGDWDKVWEGVKQIWNGALELIWGWFQLWGVGRILKFGKTFMDDIFKVFQNVWNKIKGVWNDVITEIWYFFASKFEAGKAAGTAIMNAIKAMFQTVWNAIKNVWDTVMNAIKSTASTIWNGIKSFLEGVWNGLKGVFTTVWNGIKLLADMYLNAMKTVYTTIWNAIKSTLTTIWNGLSSTFSSVWNGIKSTASSVMNAIKSVFETVWNAIKNVVKTVLDAIKSTVQSGMDGAKNIVSSVGNAIKSAFTNIWNGFKDVVSNTFNTVKSAVTSGLNSAKDVVTNFGKTFYNAGKGLIDMMAQGIKNAASAVTGAISDIASKARDFLPFSPAKTGPLSDIDKLDFGGPITDSIHRATKGIQVNLASMLELPVIGATGGGMTRSFAKSTINNNNGGNTNMINVQLDPSNMDEFYQIVEFFENFKQKKRARG
ncbi:tail length tape measure protein [Bacillus phage PBC1]|uniref:Tail length tape measure protein n=1 Tax=Bacillus phage PBC1 TaxID=1161901 RepID=I1TLF1_9CAUD|nr:tail length tape measure protein [Bacillus phage PBC1]AFE86253.1 tail length tape measure protein [Bacillus phage PBC1]